jgi:hypothetical protein
MTSSAMIDIYNGILRYDDHEIIIVIDNNN